MNLSDTQKKKLVALARALVNQEESHILVEPNEASSGYWFGGGNLARDEDGAILISGRYRNYGDSRTGVHSGDRGLEAAVFRSNSVDGEFHKILSFSKADLSHHGAEVVSIEGVALHPYEHGMELFVSSEKDVPYPEPVAAFKKPGAGVWSIDRMHAPSTAALSPETLEEVVPAGVGDLGRLHCKDPWVFDLPDGDLVLGYCTHPYTWSSSGTALLRRPAGSDRYERVSNDFLARGPVWDIAAARVTERLAVPRIGAFAEGPDLSLYFYDSCESLRQLDENPTAVKRPRGWSCEEIGGVAVGCDDDLSRAVSLCPDSALFISPHGTGCSRYVATLTTDAGIFTTWQQSQPDLSQPLVGYFLDQDRIEEILA